MKKSSLPHVGRRIRSAVLAGVGATAVLTGLLASAGTAEARVPYRHMANVWVNLADQGPSGDQRIAYSTFLASLRDAAAGYNPQETQLEDVGLIQVQLEAPDYQGVGRRVLIWINPSNLYVWGFSAQDGTTYQFGDSDLARRLAETTTPAPPVRADSVRTLNFGSNYNALSNAAGRGREVMPISWNDIRASIVQLATVGDPNAGDRQNTARSLSLMIQMLSEAARFNDVEGTFRAAMNSWDVQSLPIQQQYLENNWAALSRYYNQLVAGLNPTSLNIPTVGNVSGTDGVRRYVRLGLANDGTANGDWNHDEL
ncbi:ribosome-inactivating family protein [Kitasatospora sp. NPDC089797]|uniref:ribosome-inactivating family protein n=1 Tax=Kitasatospora sp. NPDC089797 TaxID=3155298 RepID=UPI0034165A25